MSGTTERVRELRKWVAERRELAKQAGIGQYLADSPVLTSMGTYGLLGAGLGGAVGGLGGGQGSPLGGGGAKNALIGALLGGGLTSLLGILPGRQARRMIKDKAYRKEYHKDPLKRGVWGRARAHAPAIITDAIGSAGLSLPMSAAGALLGSSIGALGHDGNSRTWDTFWSGGGTGGAVASALDHAYNGPSEDLDAQDRKKKKKDDE